MSENGCKERCPEHDYECAVVEMDEEDTELVRKVFGDQMNRGQHTHLCLNDSKNPHTWKSANNNEGE
jgi:hypothetical protein